MRLPCSNLSSIESLVSNSTTYSRETLERYKDYLKEHIDFSTYRIERTLKCGEQIEKLLKRLDSPPETVIDLINQLAPVNEYQNRALNALISRNEESNMYLTNYEKNTSTASRVANVEGSFTILGTLRNNIREQYEVKLYKHGKNEKGSFWCNCPDHKFNSKKKDIVCKHICFLVCKVAKILDVQYFKLPSKQLTQEQFDIVVSKAENLHELLKDSSICKPPDVITPDSFTKRTRTLDNEDLCPICYDHLKDLAKESNIVSCPVCTNYVHRECMNVWLSQKQTCVYCRSDVWKKYYMIR